MELQIEERLEDSCTVIEANIDVGRLIITGMPLNVATFVLKLLKKTINEKRIFDLNDYLFEGLIPSLNILSQRIAPNTWQIVWSDSKGRFPWHPECEAGVVQQQKLLLKSQ